MTNITISLIFSERKGPRQKQSPFLSEARLRRLDQRPAQPDHQQPEHQTQTDVQTEIKSVFLLQQQEHVVGKGGESGESAAESRNQKNIHRRGNQMGLLGHAEKDTDDETAHDVHRERTPRKGRIANEMGEFARQKTQAGADESAHTCNKHRFEHTLNLIFID